MADSKVSQLTAATTPLTGAELAYVVQGGNSRKTTAQAIANLVPGTDLSYTQSTRTLASSTGADVVLPEATASLPGLMAAADKALTDALIAAGVTAAGTVVTIPHIHGDLAGSVYIHVKNTSGAPLSKGTPVRVTGAVGDTTTLEVAAADAATAGTMPAIGILGDTLAANATGHAVVGGELTGLATGSYSIGQALYVAAGGGLTGTKPTTGTVQQVAIVGRVHASTGSVTVTIGALISPNWDTAYSERLRWDGGATGLDAATGRTSLGLGSLATQSGTFSGTSSGTNTGDVTLAASVADVLSLNGQELQADDPGADRLLFWDDSASKITHLTVGSYLSISGTTIAATGTTLGYDPSGRLILSSTGSGVQLPLAGAGLAGLMLAADKTKLDTIATSATANQTDAYLLSRTNHTGTQAASTITGLATVATTGAYADLSGKPTIPAAADALPSNLAVSASIGVSTDYAREDHVHALPGASQIGAASSGSITLSNLTMNTARLLGRTSASSGAIEEISVGSGLSLTSGTLSTTGSGGGLTYFIESQSITSPNATVPVQALTATNASYTEIDVAIVAKGTGATLAQVPDGTTTGGNKRGANATDWQKLRTAASQVASGSRSVISGGVYNTASGSNSAVGGGGTNQASGSYSSVFGGNNNLANQAYAGVFGGDSNQATNTYAVVLGGNNNQATGDSSAIGGGRDNLANGNGSFVSGGYRGSARGIVGYHVFPACNVPIAASNGVTQSGLLLLARQTTSNTATVLASNTSAAGTTNQVILPNNSAYSFSGEVIAGVTGAGDTSRWTIAGAIKRGANAASTAMVGTPTVTMTHNDAGASAWTVAVTADTTNGGIKVEVTGAASTTIRWVCKINTTEMTF
jgi:hypothetical protein